MLRIFLLLFLLPVPAHAWTPSLMVSGGGACASDTYAAVDGCNGALPGSSIPAPGLFNGGTGAVAAGSSYYSVRPPWYVAGVDYGVGPVGPFTSVSTLSTPGACGATLHTSYVQIGAQSGDCTFSGYDFSPDVALYIDNTCTSHTLTIYNNKFQGDLSETNGYWINMQAGVTCHVILKNNSFDSDGCQWWSGNSQMTADVLVTTPYFEEYYDEHLNAIEHAVDMSYAGAGAGTFIRKYNYTRNVAYQKIQNSSVVHGNPIIFDGTGNFASWDEEYNVAIQAGTAGDYSNVGVCPAGSPINAVPGGGSGLEYFAPASPGVISSPTISRNTLIVAPITSGTGLMSAVIQSHGGTGTVTSPTITGNYLDQSSAGAAWSIDQITGTPTYSGNVLLTNGHSCNPSDMSGSYCP